MSTQSPQLPAIHRLNQLLLQKKLDLKVVAPDIAEVLYKSTSDFRHEVKIEYDTGETVDSLVTKSLAEFRGKQVAEVTSISEDEKNSIFTKIERMIYQQEKLVQEEILYLEQQLSDLVGLTVSVERDGIALPMLFGSVRALPHLKRSPDDKLEQHTAVHEAGLDPRRSTFGWQYSPDKQQQLIRYEEYCISLPLFFMEVDKIIKELKQKKMLMVNPVSQKMAIVTIGNAAFADSSRYQIGASPELIRGLELWRPPSLGKALLLHLEEQVGYDVRLIP